MELVSVRKDETVIDDVRGLPGKRALRLRFYVILLFADMVAVFLGFYAANIIRFGSLDNSQGLTLVAAALPLFWAFSSTSYIPEILEDWRNGLTRSFLALLGAIAIVLFLGFYLKASTELSRLLTVVGFILSCVFLTLERAMIGWLARAVFDGHATSTILLCDGITMDAPPHVHVVQAGAMGLTDATPHPIVLDRLSRTLSGADVVYIACPPERRSAWSAALQGSAIHTEIVIPELAAIGIIGAKRFDGNPTVLISTGPLRARDEIMKRTLDLALVVPALIFLAPLMIVVSMAIKFDSSGPVFFRQQRVGRGNRLFSVFKFRSMRTDLSDSTGSVSATRGDVRVTRVGKFIRASSIDELPQLFNILLSDMSFVGPRPHALGSLAGDQLFWEVDDRYHHRHSCKPGLTGLAQVRGFRGATHKREDLINRLHADLEYVNGWSVRRDVSIMLATVKVVMHRNAF